MTDLPTDLSTDLWHHEDGDGPLVVLVHGTLDRSTSFVRVARRLRDLRVLRYDRRGYARSRHVPPSGRLDDHVDDLVALLAGRPAAVVGHSVGGVVALTAAARRPDLVRSVGAYEAPMPWEPWWPRRTAGGSTLAMATEDPAAAAEAFMRRMVGDARWERLPAGTKADRRAEGTAMRCDLTMIRDGTVPYVAADLAVPVVTGCGTASVDHHRAAAHHVAAAAPHGELVTVEGASHGAHLSHPAEFAALVRRVAERAG